MRLSLHVKATGYATKTFHSPGYKLSANILPFSSEVEKKLLVALIEDINAMFMTELSLEYSSARDGLPALEDQEPADDYAALLLVPATPVGLQVH
jgi:hypothetical protein